MKQRLRPQSGQQRDSAAFQPLRQSGTHPLRNDESQRAYQSNPVQDMSSMLKQLTHD